MSTSANTRLAGAAGLLLPGAAAMADEASLPSYKQCLEAFQAERAAVRGRRSARKTGQ